MASDGNQTIAVLACSAGGVAWPDNLVLWDRDLTVLGAVDLGEVTSAEHSEVKRIHQDGPVTTVEWSSYDGAGFCMKAWTAHATWQHGTFAITDLTQVGDTGPDC